MLKKVKIFTDGAARGNPDGPGGYGAILQYTDASGNLHEKELSEGFKKTTNNQMELLGVIAALECLRVPCIVDVYSDSKYVVSAFNENWIGNWQKNGWKTASKQPVKNQDLWERLDRKLAEKRVEDSLQTAREEPGVVGASAESYGAPHSELPLGKGPRRTPGE